LVRYDPKLVGKHRWSQRYGLGGLAECFDQEQAGRGYKTALSSSESGFRRASSRCSVRRGFYRGIGSSSCTRKTPLATKVAVGIVPSENAEVEELRDWKVDRGDIRSDPDIAREMLEFIEEHRVKSVAITDGIIGCPHQEGIDYDGEWCPVCEFWHGRDRFTGQRVH
jgi:hypothetical protein